LEAKNTLNNWRRISLHKPCEQSAALNGRPQLYWAESDVRNSRVLGAKPTHQSRGVIRFLRNCFGRV